MQSAWYIQFIEGKSLTGATILTLAGVILLYGAWRQPRRTPWMLILGWSLVLTSLPFWSRAGGFDSGPVIGTTLLMLAALLLVVANIDLRSRQRGRIPSPADRAPPSALEDQPALPGRWRNTAIRTLAAGPLGYLAALTVSSAALAHLGWSDANRLVGGLCLLVLLWAVAMAWSCAARQPTAALVTLAALAIIFGGLEIFLP